MNNVKIIRLMNNEDIIADIEGENEKAYSIKNPIRVIIMPNRVDPKSPQVGFAPFAEFSDDKTFSIDKSHVLCIMTPIKEFLSQYNSLFSGLVAPSSGLILPQKR